MNETLDQKLATLKLGRIRQVYPSWVEQATRSELGYAEFLDQLITEEVLARQENQLRRKMKVAGFPYAATIEQFDFSLRPELKRAVLMRFFDSSFVTSANSFLMMAILDRLLHHGEVFYLRGNSYRMRGKEPVTLTSKAEGDGISGFGRQRVIFIPLLMPDF